MKIILKLQELKVQSFITKINQSNHILGGQTGVTKCREEGDILSPGNTITLPSIKKEADCPSVLPIATEADC